MRILCIRAHNLYLTTNYASVDHLFAKVLFLIGGKISFNFGKLAFDLIVKNADVFQRDMHYHSFP